MRFRLIFMQLLTVLLSPALWVMAQAPAIVAPSSSPQPPDATALEALIENARQQWQVQDCPWPS
ncbi:MAG UNVERIFIED_CONTAM: hypothetical protein LVR18_38295 [Planctomycetaceae bacterium]|jgi:hypothetical protein